MLCTFQHPPGAEARSFIASALAYGGNIFVGQGRTVDDSYQLFTDATSRESFYVAMTRGRTRNVAGVVTERETPDALAPQAPPPRKVTAEALLSQAITRQRDDLTATEYLRREQDLEYGMAALVGRWQALTRDAQFTAYDTAMREAMPADAYEKLASDPARGTLVRHLRAAELAGADATALLREAISQRDFASASSVAAVLHGRVARLAGPVSHKALSSYSAATPDLADPQASAAARELARLADARAAELGQQAAAERPVWALHALGDPPADPVAREEWVDRASRIAAWRELASYKDPVEPVGPAPKLGAVELRAAWRGAADAAGLSKEDQGIRETPEMLLVAQVRDAVRVKAWEPADVAEEREDTELAKGDAVADAQLAEAAAGNTSGPEAAEARELADSHQQLAQELSVRAAWLAEQDEHRREWHATNAAKLARGVQARAELERRREAGEFVGEWDIANAYLTLKSDLEPHEPRTADEPEPEAEAEAEVVTEPEPNAEDEPQPKIEPEVTPAPKVEPEPVDTAETEPATEPEAGPEPESKPGPEPEADAYPWAPANRIDPHTWDQSEPQAEAVTEPEPEPVTEPPAEPVAEPETEPAEPEDMAEPAPAPKAEAEPRPEPEVQVKPEPEPAPKVEAATPEPEPEPRAEVEADAEPPGGQALEDNEAEVTAENRADHYRAIAEHREKAVEHPGRTQIEATRDAIEAARAAQARIDEERANTEAGEVPFNMGGPQREAEAEHSPEAADS